MLSSLSSDPATPPRARCISFATLAAGDRFDRYLVQRHIARGGMGDVYAAFDEQLQRRVALKLLRTDLAEDESLRDRFIRESQLMARVVHRNVMVVHAAGNHGGRAFIAMEYVEGGTLAQWERAKPRDFRDVVRMYIDAGQGLSAAHRAGLVHRDFKPDNVLLEAGRPIVTDFGLARAVDPALERTRTSALRALAKVGESLPVDQEMTAAGTFMGTPRYVSPEQLDGDRTTPASDQFSFAVCLYRALFGEFPYDGKEVSELREAIAERSPKRPRKHPARHLYPILARALAERPADRFPSMDELLARLERALRPRPWRLSMLVLLTAVVAVMTTAYRVGGMTCAREANRGSTLSSSAIAALNASLASAPGVRASLRAELVQELTSFGERLAETRVEVCRRVQRSEWSESQRFAVSACLERKVSELTAVVEALTAPRSALRARAASVVHALEPLEACLDDRADRSSPTERVQLESSYLQVARVGLSRAAGELSAARGQLERLMLHEGPRRIPSLESEWSLEASRVALASLDLDAAARFAERAVGTALVADRAVAAARALFVQSALARVARDEGGADRHGRLARALLYRGKTPPNRRAAIELDAARDLLALNQLEPAEVALTQALALPGLSPGLLDEVEAMRSEVGKRRRDAAWTTKVNKLEQLGSAPDDASLLNE